MVKSGIGDDGGYGGGYHKNLTEEIQEERIANASGREDPADRPG
jgi:hypothetical protein